MCICPHTHTHTQGNGKLTHLTAHTLSSRIPHHYQDYGHHSPSVLTLTLPFSAHTPSPSYLPIPQCWQCRIKGCVQKGAMRDWHPQGNMFQPRDGCRGAIRVSHQQGMQGETVTPLTTFHTYTALCMINAFYRHYSPSQHPWQ